MRIGIGITTKNRPKLLKSLLGSIYKYTNMSSVKIYIADDSVDNIGVAKKKNECLRNLMECKRVFLLDDDVEIIKSNWISIFTNSNHEHLLYLDKKFHNWIRSENDIDIYADCGGVLMYLTRDAINKVGAFNEDFSPYSFEHCEYSIRILGKHGIYPCPKNTEKFILSHDYSTPGHKSSITDSEKRECVKNNWDKFFNCKIENIYIPL